MKKILTLLVSALIVLSLTACSSKDEGGSAIDKIKAKGELVLLTESGFPPFEYASDEEGSVDGVYGVDIEFGKLLAEKLGVTLKVTDMDFDSLTIALAAGKGDIIAAGITNNPERAEVVNFSKTYFDNGLFVIVHKDSDIKSVKDLEGKKIAVQQGTTGKDYADKIENAEPQLFKGMVEAGLAVNNKNADASIMDKLTAQIVVSNNPNLILLDDAVESEETAIAVAKGNDDLLEHVNEVLTELQDSGQLQKWFDKHFDALLKDNQ